MRAQRLARSGPAGTALFGEVELPDPVPAADELLLEVAACAVCRTDLQIIEGDLPPRCLPVVPGHQAVGRVVAMGGHVTDWTMGERAGVGWLAATCGHCRFCRSERENLCPDATFTGWDRDGGFATRVTVRADFALRLSDDGPDRQAAPLLCGGVIGYRSLKVSGIEPGGRLGLFGFGASATLALQVAVHWDCEVHVRTRSRRGQAQALGLGAASVGGYEEPTPPLQAGVTFAPTGDVIVSALRALEPGGTLAINAIHLDRIPEFLYDILWRERGIRSVANYTRTDARAFLALAARIGMQAETQSFRLHEAGAAIHDLAAGRLSGTAVLVMGEGQVADPVRPEREILAP